MNHTVFTMYALSQSKKGWTLPLHPSEVDLSIMRFHTIYGAKNGELRRGCMSSSGVMDTIRNKMLLSVFVLFGTLVTAGGRVERYLSTVH